MNEAVGVVVSWAALMMVLVQFVVVVMRYVFGIGSIFMQEMIVYLHAVLFMIAAGYTLLHNGHVRVDIFYSTATAKRKAVTDIAGVALFLLPICVFTWWVSWPYVASAWAVREGSPEGSGIQAVYLLKTVILGFALLVSVQGISLAIRSVLVLAGIAADAGVDEDDVGIGT